MIINNIPFTVELSDIIQELQSQLKFNDIPLLSQTRDTPDNIMVSCPYHKGGLERKPSAGIRKSDGVFHCFACGEIHDLWEVISFVFGHTEDMMGSFGWNWLTKNFLTIQVEERKDVHLDFQRHNRSNTSRSAGNNMLGGLDSNLSEGGYPGVTEEEIDRYRYIHPYMYERKMTDEVIEIFDVGYDSATQSLVFPVKDIAGNCLFVARRSVKTKYFNYPKNVQKPLYGIYELYQLKQFPDTVMVTESMIDAISCWAWGSYAVALNGLGTELQFEQLRKFPCRMLVCATDNDEAGNKAFHRLRANVKNKLITRFEFPKGRKDINELSEEEFRNSKNFL